jgi:hypothetical protein
MILFNEKDHTYYHTKLNKYLTSVTTRLKDFNIEFDEEYWSEYKAEEYKTDAENVKQYWEYLRRVGTIKGSIVHQYLEKRWFGKIIDYKELIPRIIYTLPEYEFLLFNRALDICINYAELFYKDAILRFEPIEAEKIVYNDLYAGQIDLEVYDKKLQDKRIIDYKTDKKIVFYSKFGNLTKPFDYLSDCNFTKYSLQTNCYNKLGGLTLPPIIIHINESNPSYKVYKADLYPKEANIIMS